MISSASLIKGRAACDDFRSSDDENPHNYIPNSKDYRQKPHGSKYHRTPWAKMKDIINTRNSIRKKHRLSAASDDIQIDVELCTDNEDVFEANDSESKSMGISLSPSPNIYTNSSTSPCGSEVPQDIVERYQRALAEESTNSPGVVNTPSACNFGDDNRDPFYVKKMEDLHKIKNQSPTGKHRCIQMTREYDLPPDFKKKLQEWEKIKKAHNASGSRRKLGEITKWKSLGGPRSSDHSPVFEYPPISDEFRKKLEEWKQIKASGGPAAYNEQKKLTDKTPSPKLSRKNSSPKQSKKVKDPSKELHWFEKELGKIEKEKQILERERQKFMEREERLTKLRRSMLGGSTKKEILVHTPSGFHRFEGISRKFAQKLYEWEKSQGIAPESSAFALISSNFAVEAPAHSNTNKDSSGHHASSLPRSKSADSIAVSALNLTCPVLSPQPSSLSLNDMDDLEKERMNSKSSSMQYFFDGEEHYLDENFDDILNDEPEAVLVEVEDYEEETAEPLHVLCSMERHQLPVYQRQEFKPLCESETVALPKIRRSESARAQINYDIMENIVKLLTELQVTEDEIRCLVENKSLEDEQSKKSFKFLNELQNQSIKNLIERLQKLQDANHLVANNIPKDDKKTNSHLEEILDNVQVVSSEMLQLTGQMMKIITDRLHNNHHSYQATIFDQIKEIRFRIAELRRHLSYICAATDLTTPAKRKSSKNKLEVTRTLSNDSRDSKGDISDISRKSSDKDKRRFIKMEGSTNLSSSQGAVKKRIRYRQKTMNKSLIDTDDEEEPKTIKQHKKLTRTRSISEGNMFKFDPKLLAPTHNQSDDSRRDSSPIDSPITVFVKTTRKLFTPIVETSLGKSLTVANMPSIEKPKEDKTQPIENQLPLEKSNTLTSLPPLPASPVPQRKVYKEVSPGIKLIMAKYNQSIEQSSGLKSAGSSGSNSPVAWRSPVLERRVKVQTEKYQEDLKKLSPLLCDRKLVQKSSSVGFLSSAKQVTVPGRKASLNVSTLPSNIKEEHKKLRVDISLANDCLEERGSSSEIRMRKIQQAKEEFLKAPLSAPTYIEALQFHPRNRLSQISVGSESSTDHSTQPGSLMKSVSAGMINVDPDVYNRIKPEYRAEGYVSLPRQPKKSKDPKSAFSSIASKFRKVKMRRGKDRERDKQQAVETLCRQSLVVDITNAPGDEATNGNNNGDVHRQDEARNISPSISKSNSWIMRSLFKK
ncbi:unnamed protein product [Ceutorhynchus assimilis]|uniref:Uncharacterized protein n=1 Tax=Ceutorhynchus assimilis TaxID=467358 RepID=A0A9N9MVS6_9CUCU|nr:unnamed protein product [Ceutorhynchus assimilis]